jgi:hypothetical protein
MHFRSQKWDFLGLSDFGTSFPSVGGPWEHFDHPFYVGVPAANRPKVLELE